MDTLANSADVAKVLAEIHRADGVLTPDAVVERAKDRSSPLHDHFEWDDSVAAHGFRLEQARRLIRSVRIEVEVHQQKVVIPVYRKSTEVPLTEQGYQMVSEIAEDESAARQALISELASASALLRRSRRFAVYFGLQDEMDEAIAKVLGIRRSAETAKRNPVLARPPGPRAPQPTP